MPDKKKAKQPKEKTHKDSSLYENPVEWWNTNCGTCEMETQCKYEGIIFECDYRKKRKITPELITSVGSGAKCVLFKRKKEEGKTVEEPKKKGYTVPYVVRNTKDFYVANCQSCKKVVDEESNCCDLGIAIRMRWEGDAKGLSSYTLRMVGDTENCKLFEAKEPTGDIPEAMKASMGLEGAIDPSATLSFKLNKMLEYMDADHKRLARVESMLIFLLEKQALELNRRPLETEKVEGETSRVLYRKTYFEQWMEAWKKQTAVEGAAEGGTNNSGEQETRADDSKPDSDKQS